MHHHPHKEPAGLIAAACPALSAGSSASSSAAAMSSPKVVVPPIVGIPQARQSCQNGSDFQAQSEWDSVRPPGWRGSSPAPLGRLGLAVSNVRGHRAHLRCSLCTLLSMAVLVVLALYLFAPAPSWHDAPAVEDLARLQLSSPLPRFLAYETMSSTRPQPASPSCTAPPQPLHHWRHARAPLCPWLPFAAAVILDPATPRTPKHQLAEHVMTTGTTAQVLKRHMDSVIKVGGCW